MQKTVHYDAVNKTGTEAVLSIDSKFSGIASVDLKENAAGVPCVTEINPGRMFTTSYFFSLRQQDVAQRLLRKHSLPVHKVGVQGNYPRHAQVQRFAC